jgi:hypothetical protein
VSWFGFSNVDKLLKLKTKLFLIACLAMRSELLYEQSLPEKPALHMHFCVQTDKDDRGQDFINNPVLIFTNEHVPLKQGELHPTSHW